jgi:hypothetical protein
MSYLLIDKLLVRKYIDCIIIIIIIILLFKRIHTMGLTNAYTNIIK